MPIQHSPPARQTISQARAQAVITPTPRDPHDRTHTVPELRAQLDKGPIMAGEALRCGYKTLIKNQVLFLSSKFV
ncbi:hypothetical protein O181_125913 [Austropuccinia psidii MF-1]|uniref:Uncharacterized protein n=1 Tax=Austropuccinia psidii MF-1 TaxID=1389203 RepID=A0A9Q3KQJ0_9BASI|nr:hypothetical protein [Austropuccinia psidii MF-1]